MVFAPPGSSLAELAAVAGLRWAVEECFEHAKDDFGLDHCEARSWARMASPYKLVPSVPEIHYLLAPIQPVIIAWSLWRRRHQAAPPSVTTNGMGIRNSSTRARPVIDESIVM
ncbi:hypothetical protein X760_18210 [Mesorhizobium sp. LSHC422A00]|nr:hypothetical protein X762_31805 [Mesorhizobium sp. LSHC426A00]ESX60160.1 hypothetical protein X760_18210 [Mesorhizobium sp. LSHC422A00]